MVHSLLMLHHTQCVSSVASLSLVHLLSGSLNKQASNSSRHICLCTLDRHLTAFANTPKTIIFGE